MTKGNFFGTNICLDGVKFGKHNYFGDNVVVESHLKIGDWNYFESDLFIAGDTMVFDARRSSETFDTYVCFMDIVSKNQETGNWEPGINGILIKKIKSNDDLPPEITQTPKVGDLVLRTNRECNQP